MADRDLRRSHENLASRPPLTPTLSSVWGEGRTHHRVIRTAASASCNRARAVASSNGGVAGGS